MTGPYSATARARLALVDARLCRWAALASSSSAGGDAVAMEVKSAAGDAQARALREHVGEGGEEGVEHGRGTGPPALVLPKMVSATVTRRAAAVPRRAATPVT